MKARYLTYFSYIGTHFRSSEKLWLKGGQKHLDPESIQGLLEIALLKLRSQNHPRVCLSSRTDGGVHALNSCAHIDLDRRGPEVYEPEYVVNAVNKFFTKNDYSICVRKCIRVPDTFNARHHALARKYLYRLAVIKKGVTIQDDVHFTNLIPIEEWKRCLFINSPEFDVCKLKEGAAYFPGYHDFGTFKKSDKRNDHKHNRRLLLSLDVCPGLPLITSFSTQQEQLFDYWDIYFYGKSFVHNQVKSTLNRRPCMRRLMNVKEARVVCQDRSKWRSVVSAYPNGIQIRRIMAVLVGVAVGKLPVEEIKVLLQVPSKHSWPTHLSTCPPHGLFLCNVEYDPKHLVYSPQCKTDSQETNDIVSDSA